jgi:MoxR-like ATPase
VLPQGEEQLLGIIDRTTGDDEIAIQPVLNRDDLAAMQRTVRQVLVAEFVQRYAARLALGTHPGSPHATDMTRRFVRYGVSPRGVQALVLAGKVRALLADRFNVSCQDIRDVVHPALRHRVIRNFEAEAEGITTDAIITRLLESVAEPAAAA